ncbi:MAG: helix-turn-helix transcriptional regulator [Muribaculaceae bacterium]
MSKDLFNRYIWMVETIRRRGRITRAELDSRWRESEFNDGTPLCRRTLYNYRNAIAEVFNIRINVDKRTYEYYIEENESAANSVSNWMLNARALADTLTAAQDVAGRIMLEDIPSARENLGTAISAIRQRRCLRFDYYSYTRTKPTRGVVVETYFLRVFKQRWYVVGLNVNDRKIKTYALDRMKNLTVTDREYNPDDAVGPEEYFRDAFGIVVTKGAPKRVAVRTDAHTAHYLRDLPLHPSQQEMLHDGFSIFYYNMLISDELVDEIVSYGPRMTVLEPPELRTMVIAAHREALDNYTKK